VFRAALPLWFANGQMVTTLRTSARPAIPFSA
jgi:hypothetical protein